MRVTKVAAVLVLASVVAASAKVTIVWTTGWEVKNFGGGNLPSGSIAQLIYSPTATATAPSGGSPFSMTGDNVLLGSFTFSGLDGYIDTSVNFTPNPGFGYLDSGNVSFGLIAGIPIVTGAGVFTRVFNSGTVPTYYGDGGWDTSLTEQLPTPGPTDVSNIAETSDFIVSTQIIPEPAAMAFAFAGLGALVVRRIRRRN